MTFTYDDDERSTSASRPIDLYTIATTSATYRITSHIVNVDYGGHTFKATTMSRGNQQVAQDLTGRELIVFLPIDHPVVQRYAAFGVPEQNVLVTLQRLQERSGIATQQWQGFGNALLIEGHVAQLHVPSITDDAMKVRLPMVAAQRTCPHVLFDSQCSPPFGTPPLRSTSGTTRTLVSQTIAPGLVTLVLTGGSIGADGYCTFGDVVVGGELRQCLSQTGTTMTINAPFPGIVEGTAVTTYPGCDHTIETCRDKFSNVVNFGAEPQLNGTNDMWWSQGLGVVFE